MVAAANSNVLTKVGRRRVIGAIRLWGDIIFRGHGVCDRSLSNARMEVCRACPVFCKDSETCGSPESETPKAGCWCYMPVKIRFRDATCWLDDTLQGNAAPYGWLANLPKASTGPKQARG